MQLMGQIKSERLFLNSINSKYTQTSYKFYLKRYLDLCGYKEMDDLLARDHKHALTIASVIESKSR